MSGWGAPPRASTPRRRAPGGWSREGAGSWVLVATTAVVPGALLAAWLVADGRNRALGWLVGVVTASGLLVATVLRDRSRSTAARAMADWGRRVGWVAARDGRAPLAQWPGLGDYLAERRAPRAPSFIDAWRLPPFGVARATVEGVLTGLYRGRPAVSLEYGQGGGLQLRATQARYHVVAIRLPRALPTVWFSPRWTDAPAVAGGREVLFESAEFNDRWRVTGDDPTFVHAAVTPLVMTRLLRPDATGLELRVEGDWVVHWRLGRPDPGSTDRVLGVLADVVDAFPPFVRGPDGAGAGHGPCPVPGALT